MKVGYISLLAQALAIVCVAIPTASFAGTGEDYIVNSGTGGFNGPSINNFVGANTFYANGFTGTRSIAANIEGGRTWGGHEVFSGKTITDITAYNSSYIAPTHPDATWGGALGDYDRHATWVGAIIAGKLSGPNAGEYQRGIAYGSNLWAGGIADQFSGGSFNWTDDRQFFEPYRTALDTGINGKTADVVNGSWGFTDQTGNNPFVKSLDWLVGKTKKVLVFAAGNAGPGANTVASPAAGFNAIVVGALGPGPGYTSVAGFSSRGLNDYYDPTTNTTIKGVRARVDILAPGQNMTSAAYLGASGGNWNGLNNLTPYLYSTNIAGTSFAAPTVAGGVALVVDAAKGNGYANGTDSRVVKSVLQAGADHLTGWDNQMVAAGGIMKTSQALDAAQGAGKMDLTNSYSILTAGTTDVAGQGGGSIKAVGWDLGTVAKGGKNDYFGAYYNKGSELTVALNWYQHDKTPTYGVAPDTSALLQSDVETFTNLQLQIFSMVGAAFGQVIASSEAKYLTTQYLDVKLNNSGRYGIRVLWGGQQYDYANVGSEQYGLAWNSVQAVPEPASLAILGVGVLTLLRRRKK